MRPARLLLLLSALLPGTLYSQGHAVSSRELARRGFFQDFAELDLESLLKPDELSVGLASRSDLSLEDAPGLVTIVTASEIHKIGALTLADVLRTVPGFDVLVDNLGRQTLVVRGAPGVPGNGSSEKVLILFNGHPLNEAITGGATAENLQIPVGGLKKIEILRGPGSALFGSGALLAVVNLVSETTAGFTGTAASVGVGNFGTQNYELKFGQVLGEVNLSGFLHFDRSDGDPLLIPEDTQTLRDPAQEAAGQARASLSPGTVNDGIKTVDTEYHLTYRNFELNARFKGESGDGYLGLADALGVQNNLASRQYAFDLGYTSLAGPYIAQAKVDYTRSENEEHLNPFPPGFARFSGVGQGVGFGGGVFVDTSLGTQKFGAEGLLQRTSSNHHLEGGVSLSRESTIDLSADSNMDYVTFAASKTLVPIPGAVPDEARTSTGVWVQDTWKAVQRLTLTGALRWDHLNDVGGVWSPQIGAVYPLSQGPILKLLYGRSYRAPSFDELYFELPGLDPNPKLRPESADTVQGVFLWKRSDLFLNVDYFFTALSDPITTADPYDFLEPQSFENGPGVHQKGLEVELRRVFLSGNSVFLNYTHESDVYASTGLAVPDAPANIASLGGDIQVRNWFQMTPSLFFRDSMPRAVGDLRPSLPSVGLLDVNLRSRKIYRSLQLTLTAHNLLGKAYADPSPLTGVPGDYPRPGRSVLVLLSYKF